MKHLKYYNQLFETKLNKELYHGTPYFFKEFKFKKYDTVYLTDSKEFAEDYASQKSMDMGMHNETKIYVIKPDLNIFDINNEKEYIELYDALPDKVEFAYNSFGMTAELPKEEIILNMKGIGFDEPIENVVNANIGDHILTYDKTEYVIFKKDEEYAYGYHNDKLQRFIDNLFSRRKDSKANEIFADVYAYLKKYIKEHTDDYVSDDMMKFYNEVLLDGGGMYGVDVDKKHMEEYDEIFENDKKKLIEYLKENPTKFNLVKKEIELTDTWNYFENVTVIDTIKKLGYDGYVAKEMNKNTYAVFNVDKIKIIGLIYRDCRFDSLEEYKKFNIYHTEIFNILEDKIGKLPWINYHEVYRNFKKNIPAKEASENENIM